MKFLLNMNIPRSLGIRLMQNGHEYRHVGDIGMFRSKDIGIVQFARENGEVIITHDLDYGNILAFSGDSAPSVIIFRLRYSHPNNLFCRMIAEWDEIESHLLKGAIIIIEDSTLRIRDLPIQRSLDEGETILKI